MPPLLKVVLHEPDWVPSLMALCPGYELSKWRAEALADEMSSWLPSFVLPWSEQQEALGSETAVKLLRRAADAVYKTDKYKRRGEFGELLLHGVLKQEYATQAAVSKLWLKDSNNDTVKGFDVVHITEGDSARLHLWLGEAKFYSNLSAAVRDAADEVKEHLKSDYLRREFIFVSNKIDPNAPFADRLQSLLDENTSLDDVFDVLHIPVLLTYDSAAVAAHSSHCGEYFEALRLEAESAWQRVLDRCGDVRPAVLHLVLVPLFDRAQLTDLLHARLAAWQSI